jgi:cobalt-zinc-cadmium efflux system protein
MTSQRSEQPLFPSPACRHTLSLMPDHTHHPQHDHRHAHAEEQELSRRRLVIVLVLTAVFMGIELVGGLLANSLALIADAGHMLSDVGALGLSWFAMWFAKRPATAAKSYGYRRLEILAALANGVALTIIALTIFWQAWLRFHTPEPVQGGLMLGVAVAGLAVNLGAAAILHRSSAHSLNLRGAYLHVMGDLLGSVGAIIAAVLILLTGWLAADPLISCLVAGLILFGSWRLVMDSVDILLEAVPRHLDLDAVRKAILQVPGVEEVHDLHVWTLTSGFLAMSGHAVIADPMTHRAVLDAIHSRMHDDFGISHVTVQVDYRRIYRIENG